MRFFDTCWEALTSLLSILSLSPVQDGVNDQTPLALPSVLPATPLTKPVKFPEFAPPGGKGSEFKCEYPAMKGWEYCSSPRDRKCWLRRTSDGKQYDINTDYENEYPIGITRYYEMDIQDSWFAADGLLFKEAKLFNDSYPGPWIQACWGDTLVVNVTNRMAQNGTSVHWHGIRQLNTVHMDGVNGVTQCPIARDDYFVYNFTLRQYGSSWYHSHYSVQYADGAVGPLTIHGPTSADWDEAYSPPLIMTDWYHRSAFHVLTNPTDTGGKDILLNGRGDIRKFNNSMQNETEVKPPLQVHFEKAKPGSGCRKYLLRVINTSFDTTFVFSIDNHMLQVVSADFVPIQPYHNTSILVGIGQRYNVIVEASPIGKPEDLDPNGNYWIRTQISPCFRGSDKGDPHYDETGILRYGDSKLDPTSKPWTDISLACSDETFTSLNPILPWVVKAPSNGKQNKNAPRYGEAFEVYYNADRAGQDYPIAGFTMDDTGKGLPMRVDYSDPIFFHLNPKDKKNWPDLWRVVPENYTNNDWIYLVFEGQRKSGGKTSLAHPIHLHGHDFAILEQVENRPWDPDRMNLKLVNPPRRDVVLLPSNGYVVIAFKADNPGPWLVHCHIAVHISMGLGMQIMEDQAGAFGLWPGNDPATKEATRVCNNWKKWYGNQSNWAYKPLPSGKCNYTNPAWCFQDDSGV